MENLYNVFLDYHKFLGHYSFSVTLFFCFLWGIFSVAFCPCHLALIPLMIGYIKDMKSDSFSYSFKLALCFGLGIFLVICSIGLVTIGLGKVLEEKESILDYIVGVIFILVGLHLTGLFKYHHHDHCHEEEHDEHCDAPVIKINKKGFVGAFVCGLIFALLLSPCTFAYMAPILGAGLKKAMNNGCQAFFMFIFYAIGNAGIIVLAGTSTEWISKYNHWNHDIKATKIIKIICGILIIFAGIHMFFE